jgi:hypothetical protein
VSGDSPGISLLQMSGEIKGHTRDAGGQRSQEDYGAYEEVEEADASRLLKLLCGGELWGVGI